MGWNAPKSASGLLRLDAALGNWLFLFYLFPAFQSPTGQRFNIRLARLLDILHNLCRDAGILGSLDALNQQDGKQTQEIDMVLAADGAGDGGAFLLRALLGDSQHTGRKPGNGFLPGSRRQRLLRLPYGGAGYAFLADVVGEG